LLIPRLSEGGSSCFVECRLTPALSDHGLLGPGQIRPGRCLFVGCSAVAALLKRFSASRPIEMTPGERSPAGA
jgi:hypothetical protein